MCTSVTLKSSNNHHLLARTMDFSFELEPELVFYPRHAKIAFQNREVVNEDHYAFIGLAKNVGSYQLADGVNEHGLSIAALYFEGYATFEEVAQENISVAGYEVVKYVLATYKNSQEVLEFFENTPIYAAKIDFIGIVPPLHWTVQDASGAAYVIELTQNGVEIHENKIGVMANSPDYNWHLTNVRSYVGLDPKPAQARTFFGQEFLPFGGGRTFGLPGDYSSPSRFIRTLYGKLSVESPKTEDELVLSASHILNGVDIPKGNVVTVRNTIDYTQYTAYIVTTTQTYFYRLHDGFSIKKFALHDFDLNADEIVVLEA